MASLLSLLLRLLLLLLPTPSFFAAADAGHLLAAKAAVSDPTNALSSWDPRLRRSTCRWAYVSCSPSGTAVTALLLGNLSLAGNFPTALCSLTSLTHLDLSENDLSGPLPACLAALPSLTYLNLMRNNFSSALPAAYAAGFPSLTYVSLAGNSLSEFPAVLANVTNLQELRLAFNPFLPSTLPEEFSNLASLRVLWLTSCGLEGKIPASIGNLKSLVNLDLSENNLTGDIPWSIANLTSVVQIELYSNQLTGAIPEGLGNLKRLQFLDASMNRLSGEIPGDLFLAPRLKNVHLYENELSGRLPASLGRAGKLEDLRLFSNRLVGGFPPEFGRYCPLSFLDLSDNQLSGRIPATLCASGKLEQLLLLDNALEGAIPAAFGQCQTLTRVRLQNNRLSGNVPPAFWALPHVHLLELRDNALSGIMDPAIAGARNLSQLLIYNNQFTGPLPPELGSLANLCELSASNNGFSGPLPASLAELSRLGQLNLKNNSLSGELPRDVRRWRMLTQLDISNNRLMGSIPLDLGLLPVLNSLDLSNNQLSGEVPVELQNLKLSEFNLSNNRLTGVLPPLFYGNVYSESFLGNPGLCRGVCPSGHSRNAGQRGLVRCIASLLAVSTVMLLLSVAWFYYKYRSYKRRASRPDVDKSRWVLTSFHKVEFNEADVVNCLDEDNVIGMGAAGKVYKAVVGQRGEAMAVKKLWGSGVVSKENGKVGDLANDTFETEVATLGKIRHKNIVKLWCCIRSNDTRLLVYEYMPNGSLGDLLHRGKGGPLDWPVRYKIALGAAEGLSYLHHDCVPPIVHRDVKSNNILLDEEFGTKVADFGVAKTIGDGPATMSVIAGSCGYIAPEYAYTLRITEKSDIYSFGVVILELITGKKPIGPELGEKDLATWVSGSVEQNGVDYVLDPNLAGKFKREMCKVLNIALLCVSNLPNNRPSMRSVVKMLLEVSPDALKAKKEKPLDS